MSSLPNLIIQTPMSGRGRRKSPAYTPVRGLRKGLVADGTVNLTPGSPERVAAEAEEKALRDVRDVRSRSSSSSGHGPTAAASAGTEKENVRPSATVSTRTTTLPQIGMLDSSAAVQPNDAPRFAAGRRAPRGRGRSTKVHPAAAAACTVVEAMPPHPPAPLEKLLVVLDMDDTLIHTTFMDSPMASRPPRRGTQSFPIVLDDGERASVARRPGLHEFLAAASEKFDLALFTAAEYGYAAEVLAVIDPGGRFIPEERRFYRRDCFKVGPRYVKDLRVVLARCFPERCFGDFANVDPNARVDNCDLLMKRVVLVDDNPWSFAPQPHNGIPVKKFVDDPSDGELIKLQRFLLNASRMDDVQPYLQERFRIEESLARHRGMTANLHARTGQAYS